MTVRLRRAVLPPPDAPPVPHRRLLEPSPARPSLRHLFNPDTGWFRRLERHASQALSRQVFPRIPGMERPYSRQVERGLVLSEALVRIERLPAGFEGLRVLLVTDLHAGPFLAQATLVRALDRLMAEAPDLILLGGDFVTSRLSEFPPCAAALRRLRAPLGVYGVLGNHDLYVEDPESLAASIEDCGVNLLRNRAVLLERGGGEILLAGIDDLLFGKPDLDRALSLPAPRRAPAMGRPVVLLSHNPDVLFEASRRGVCLVLSGHTHGGQVRVPGLPVLVRQSRYRLDQGRLVAGGTELIVSRGLGVTGIPLRIHCPPEAVLLTLRSRD